VPVTPDATEYILSELTRRLNEVASRLETGLLRLDQVYVRKDVYDQWQKTAEVEHNQLISDRKAAIESLSVSDRELARRIQAIEDGKQWLLRLCAGSLITTVISVAVTVILVTRH
jgi:hypothetical protein